MQLFDDDSVLFAVSLFSFATKVRRSNSLSVFKSLMQTLHLFHSFLLASTLLVNFPLSLDRVCTVSIALIDNNYDSRWMHNDLQVALVGTKVDLTYSYEVQYICELCLYTGALFSSL